MAIKFSEEHEWIAVEGVRARIGITDFAQDSLGDVVYVELPGVGANVMAHAGCAEIESTKSVSELFSPVTGTLVRRRRADVDGVGSGEGARRRGHGKRAQNRERQCKIGGAMGQGWPLSEGS